ncbi:GNAT family N-acetyltransferase [Arthrobacter sp. N199823]|uniref:GNAT family N-acetyltransferase n=1 Tax=Arthrobacter sp. N199823 TaxID=2058895 RepID=UPI000CE39939|nr:GNAT family N-acetyltransferase [Arthrobacter sp. N199823]
MQNAPVALSPVYETFDGVAPSSVWVEVAAIFSSAFSVAPYFEDEDTLAEIVEWGPDLLALGGGRLSIARCAEKAVGFALVHGLQGDDSWEGTLSSMVTTDARIKSMVSDPGNTVVVPELAVHADSRGLGIARSALASALEHCTASNVVLGVYEQAETARQMYARWGYQDLGAVLIQDGAVRMRVLSAELQGGAELQGQPG